MTIAIVDGYSTGAALAARLHHLGVPCAHIKSQPDNHDFLRRTYNPAHYTRDFGFVPDLGTLAERLRREGTTRVVAGSESGVTTAEALSHALGLPTNAPEQSAARRDKNLMAATVRAAGLATPRTHLAASPATAAQWFATSGLPEAVVKPLASAGSDGVRFCRTPADVHDATRTVLDSRNIFGQPNTTALVQERLLGTEYYINTVTLNGRHKVAETWRYTKQVRPGAGPIYDYEEPVPANTPEARLLHAYTFAVLDALGIRNSPAHTEVMLTATGPVLIETGARLGGATSPAVVEQHCGMSQTALAAAALAAPKAFDDFDDRHLTWTGALRNVEFINHRAGRADRAAMIRAAALPSAVEVCPAVDHGDPLRPTADLLSTPGYLYLAAETEERVERDYLTLRQWERDGLHTGGLAIPAASTGP
ncbi:ATP-grasp domain-containing protein [Streptomyces sp. RM72]|uniref:ATP-grasp domain-containing protein n=1 Tax=Streptomyces sp. RM72 TaxID=1115510 RepID=UPI001B358A70|nr:ATP-grasp domain-containing protein [Streptomyces sp. RM72]MBQ0888592.1 ATP-grasp domain-containing protein [Streptomyces sp. RM72]